MSFLNIGDSWWPSIATQKIGLDLLQDLSKANTLIVGCDPVDYSMIWDQLTDDEREKLRRKGKVEIDVNKPVVAIVASLRELITDSTLIPESTVEEPVDVEEPVCQLEGHDESELNQTNLEECFERLQLLDFPSAESLPASAEIALHEEGGGVNINPSPTLSRQIQDIVEQSQRNADKTETRPTRKRKRNDFGSDFVL